MPQIIDSLANVGRDASAKTRPIAPWIANDLKGGGRHKLDIGLMTQQFERLAEIYSTLGQPEKARCTQARLLELQTRKPVELCRADATMANGASWQSLLQVAINRECDASYHRWPVVYCLCTSCLV